MSIFLLFGNYNPPSDVNLSNIESWDLGILQFHKIYFQSLSYLTFIYKYDIEVRIM